MLSKKAPIHLNYRPDIDGLRALAVLAVLAFHVKPTFLQGGFAGVDLFFVISGYLISSIIYKNLDAGSFSFTDFWGKRIRRIFPVLALVLASCLGFGYFALLPVELEALGKHVLGGIGFVSNIVLWTESGYFDSSSELKPLLHLWSLGIEEQFYLFWPLIAVMAFKLRVKVIRVAVFMAVVSYALNLWLIKKDLNSTFYLLHTRLWELMMGAILAYLTVYHHRFLDQKLMKLLPSSMRSKSISVFLANFKAVLGLILLVSAYSLNSDELYPGWRAILPVMAAFFLIDAGLDSWFNRRVLASKVLVWIGLISYPLYLWHWPIISFLHITDAPVPDLVLWAAAAVSVLLAWLSYRFLELPLRRWQTPKSRRVVTVGLLCVMGILASLAVWVVQTKGFPQRAALSGQLKMIEQLSGVPTGDFEKDSYYVCKERYGLDWDVCRTNQVDQKPEVVLIGDSHALSLYPGLSKELTQKNIPFLAIGYTGCPPMPGLENNMRGVCDRYLSGIYKMLLEPNVKTVVMSARGPFYMDGEYLDTESKREGRISAMVWSTLNKDLSPDLAYSFALNDAFKRLSDAGKKVVFVLDSAELGFHPSECFDLRPLRLFQFNPRAVCGVSKQEFDVRNTRYRTIVAYAASKYPQSVQVFDAASVFCDEQTCHGAIDGLPMYYDYNHLGLAGAARVAKKLVAQTQLGTMTP